MARKVVLILLQNLKLVMDYFETFLMTVLFILVLLVGRTVNVVLLEWEMGKLTF